MGCFFLQSDEKSGPFISTLGFPYVSIAFFVSQRASEMSMGTSGSDALHSERGEPGAKVGGGGDSSSKRIKAKKRDSSKAAKSSPAATEGSAEEKKELELAPLPSATPAVRSPLHSLCLSCSLFVEITHNSYSHCFCKFCSLFLWFDCVISGDDFDRKRGKKTGSRRR